MAKAKQNKSALIRAALEKYPDKTPKWISELMMGKGLTVSAQYVSTIKSNAGKKNGKKGRKAKRFAGQEVGNGLIGIAAALEFIKATGGLEAAKAALGTVEDIGNAVR